MNEGAIDLSQGEVDPLKGPTVVGTGREKDIELALSTLVDQLNESFGTEFTEADQLFFDPVRSTAELDEKIVEAAKANSEANFSAFFGRVLDDLFIERMEGNDEFPGSPGAKGLRAHTRRSTGGAIKAVREGWSLLATLDYDASMLMAGWSLWIICDFSTPTVLVSLSGTRRKTKQLQCEPKPIDHRVGVTARPFRHP